LAAVPDAAPLVGGVEYLVVRSVEHPLLQDVLNGHAVAGWRLHSLTPAHGGYLCVLERPV
jgi:hypothetical protein